MWRGGGAARPLVTHHRATVLPNPAGRPTYLAPLLSPAMFRLSTLALVLACALPATAQERANDEARPSPNALVGQTVGTTEIAVTYGRPSVRERLVFGSEADGALVPLGQTWRTGANEATTVSVSDTVRVEGRALAPGTYALFTVPSEGNWTVVFNRVATQWGAYRYDAGEDALRVTVTPDREAPMQEQFEIRFADVTDTAATMLLHWDRTGVPIRFEAHGAAGG